MLDVIEVTQRVERGAAFLDGIIGPEWVDRINLDTLRLSSACNCIAGQLHNGSFLAAMTDWFDAPSPHWATVDSAEVQLGFNLSEVSDAIDEDADEDPLTEQDEPDNWDLLQSAWVGLITVRRSRAKAGA